MRPKEIVYHYFILRSGLLERYCSELVKNFIEANKNRVTDDCNNITIQQNIAEAISTYLERTDLVRLSL
jgi:hypothetical protein